MVLLLGLIAPSAATAQPRADGTQRGPRAPVPLDGIAAVVDESVIFRSDVALRAKPFLERLSKDPVQRRVQLGALHKELLQHMIDELLVAKDAAVAQISVTDAEVAAGVAQVAAKNNVTRAQLEAEVKRQGLTVREYEEEVRRQIVEGKWLNLRVAVKLDRVALSDPATLEQQLLQERAVYVQELRKRAYIEVR